MHDAFFGVEGGQSPYAEFPKDPEGSFLSPGSNADAAVAAAACTALSALYPSQRTKFEAALNNAAIPAADAAVSGAFGRAVAHAIVAKLGIKATDPGVSDKGYEASFAHGRHRQDPDNPMQGFYGPFYGTTVTPIAVTKIHTLDPPPQPGSAEYGAALAQVRTKGGATTLNSTTRTPVETLIGLFWAYDGVSMIGTPPRFYNQIIRQIAQAKGNTPAQNARLFALVNAAMGDAATFAWREKFIHDLWRPVLGVREHDPSLGPTASAENSFEQECDPFWLPLGAPRTNEAKKSFTPPFPAYPSGHATFGAAAFQMVRRFYGTFTDEEIEAGAQTPDDIAFDMVSDEPNGLSTDMNGTVRPRHKRHFDSLWQAIFENGLSRVFLGVHWMFDAFAASDVQDDDGAGKAPADIRYTQQIGGVKLGLDIANDIYAASLTASDQSPAVAANAAAELPRLKVEPTIFSRQ